MRNLPRNHFCLAGAGGAQRKQGPCSVPVAGWPAGRGLDGHGRRLPVCVARAVQGFLLGDRGPFYGTSGRLAAPAIGTLVGAERALGGGASCPPPPAVNSEARRPCGLGGGRAGGPLAWLLRRARGPWSELWGRQGWCRQVELACYRTHAYPRPCQTLEGARQVLGSSCRSIKSPPGSQRAGRSGKVAGAFACCVSVPHYCGQNCVPQHSCTEALPSA